MASMIHWASFVVCTVLVLAGCGSETPNMQPTPANHPAGTFPVTLNFVIPIKKQPAKYLRVPQYVSNSTRSVTIAIDNAFPTTVTANCTASPCTVTVDVTPGTHILAVRLWDAVNGGGNELSSNISASCTVVAQSANTCPITLYGYPASFSVTSSSSNISGSQAGGFTFLNGVSSPFSIVVLDADGNAIMGTGAITPSVTSTNTSVTIATPGATSSPGVYSIGDSGTSAASLSLSAAPAPNSDGAAIAATVVLNGASLDSNTLFFLNGSKLYAVSGSTGLQTASFSTAVSESRSYIAATRGFAVINGTGSPTLYIYNLASQVAASTITTSCISNDNIPLAAAAGFIYYECDGTVYEYTTAGTPVTSWSDGENPTGVIAAGGGYIYTVNGTAMRVWTPAGTLSRTITLAGSPGNWGISAGQAGVFISAGGKTHEYSPTTGVLLSTISTGAPDCDVQPFGNSLTVHLSGSSFAVYNDAAGLKTGMFTTAVSPLDCRVGFGND